VTMPGDSRDFSLDDQSAHDPRGAAGRVGALACGRRLFDLAHGWGGRHPSRCRSSSSHTPLSADWDHLEAPFISSHSPTPPRTACGTVPSEAVVAWDGLADLRLSGRR
jgi:hypothetical protein